MRAEKRKCMKRPGEELQMQERSEMRPYGGGEERTQERGGGHCYVTTLLFKSKTSQS